MKIPVNSIIRLGMLNVFFFLTLQCLCLKKFKQSKKTFVTTCSSVMSEKSVPMFFVFLVGSRESGGQPYKVHTNQNTVILC